MEGVNASLKRLQVDHIDLYQIHGRDPFTPLEETLDALDDCVRAGKVRYLGLCNLSAWEIMKSQWISDKKNLARFESLQMYYSVAGPRHRARDRPLAKDQKPRHPALESACRRIAVRASFRARTKNPDGARRATLDFPPVDRERALPLHRRHAANRRGQPGIGGPGRARVAARTGACHLGDHRRQEPGAAARQHRRDRARLSPEQIQAITEASMLPNEYPQWMLTRQSGTGSPGQ
jgi:hypothetical protein